MVLSRRLYLLFAWLILACGFFGGGGLVLATEPDEVYDDTITIVQGQTTLLPFPGVVRVSIGEEDLANAQPAGSGEVLLTGLKSGVTDLRVWSESGLQKRYLLKIVDNSWVRILEVANIVLSDVEGVNAREDNGIVFVEGRILRDQDVGIVEDLRKKLETEVKAGKVVFNVVMPNVNLQAMVMLDVHVVEVRRQELNNIGVQWDAATQGPYYGIVSQFHGAANSDKLTSVGGFLVAEEGRIKIGQNQYIGTSIGSKLNFLQNEGVARVLAQPKLITRSGSQAEFLAGGEIPIPTVNKDGEVRTFFKQVGVILKISPKADPDGFIETFINVEVSQVDDSVQVLGIPGFTTRKTKMEMNVLSGQTMVISGMLQAEDSKSVDKVPGLSKIPILGELFKSRDFQEKTTELMIFVTPILIDPDSKKNQDMIDYAKDLNKSAKDDTTKFSIFD